jgi:hypothetical protein
MRRCAVAVCLLALGLPVPLTGSSTTESTLAGHVSFTDGRAQLSGDLAGGLQGRLTLDLGTAAGVIDGHAWRLELQRQDGEGTWYDAGVLFGTVLSGSMSATEDGQTVTADRIELAVNGGDGELADIVAGSGQLRFTIQSGETPRASGTLTLTF